MKCLYHHDRDAVLACPGCGRGLCPGCHAPGPGGREVCSEACARRLSQADRIDVGARTSQWLMVAALGVLGLLCLFAGVCGLPPDSPGELVMAGIEFALGAGCVLAASSIPRRPRLKLQTAS